jgi:hypothetical protein
MTLLTVYLVLIAGSRLDMVWLPMFHAGLAAVMFWLGGVGQHKEAPAMVLSTNPHDGFPPQGSV